MSDMTVFGSTGYIGNYFISKNNCLVVDRKDRIPKSQDVLYLISTVDNYNIFSNIHLDIDTNLTVLVDVLEAWKNINPTTGVFNYVSSWFVYGRDSILPATEESIANPTGFYSSTKLCAEHLVRSFCETHNLNYRILRICNVYGDIDKKSSNRKNALQFLISKIKKNEDISLYYDGDFLRSYMHIDDVCSAINLVCKKGNVNQIYNIAPDEPSKFIDIINIVINETRSKSNISNIDATHFHKVVQVKDMWMCNNKIKLIGFKQNISMREGIIDLCKQF